MVQTRLLTPRQRPRPSPVRKAAWSAVAWSTVRVEDAEVVEEVRDLSVDRDVFVDPILGSQISYLVGIARRVFKLYQPRIQNRESGLQQNTVDPRRHCSKRLLAFPAWPF